MSYAIMGGYKWILEEIWMKLRARSKKGLMCLKKDLEEFSALVILRTAKLHLFNSRDG